ncbi:hypothetical protein [Bacillus sp. AFS088145]|uniref:hypothetical protein n=1 Tax=Bacillus sp. AFS088145 TaxID=2033514 RepID=UPI002570F71A|nr:hypothetical protein [Bacillus sp. AFS088145]
MLSDELKTNGAIIVTEPELSQFEWGVWKEFAVRDLDGYVIGFGTGHKIEN